MTERIPQSTAKTVLFKAYSSTDHVSEATGKTIAITISKNGAAFGNPNAGATNATEISNGWYKVALDTTDTGTIGPLAVRGAVSGIDDVGILLEVVKATNAGFTALPDTACTTNASLLTSGTSTAQLSVASGQVTVATNNDKTGYTASTVSDKTGYALTSAYDAAKTAAQAGDAMTLTAGAIQAIWDALTSALTAVGSIGKLLVTNIDAAISSRSTYAGGDTGGTTTLLSRLTSTRAGNLDNLDAAVSTRSTYDGSDTAGTASLLSRLTATRAGLLDNVDAAVSTRLATSGYTTPPTVAQVRSEMDANSMKLAHLDADVSSRLASGSYTAPDNIDIAAIKAKTDNLPASPAATSDIPTSDVAAIKNKTDSLTFTVGGMLDANILAVNSVTVHGDGGTAPWGP